VHLSKLDLSSLEAAVAAAIVTVRETNFRDNCEWKKFFLQTPWYRRQIIIKPAGVFKKKKYFSFMLSRKCAYMAKL